MDIDIARATDKELDALYEARTTALEGALIKALLSERSYSREGWGRAATNSGLAYERGQRAETLQAEVARLSKDCQTMHDSDREAVREAERQIASLKAEVGRLFGLKETYSTAAFNLQAQLRDAELQAETLRAEVERLKVEEADTRNSYTALKHSAGDVLVRAEAAELQLSALRPAVLDLLHEIAEDKDRGQSRYEGYGAVFNALHAAYQGTAKPDGENRCSCEPAREVVCVWHQLHPRHDIEKPKCVGKHEAGMKDGKWWCHACDSPIRFDEDNHKEATLICRVCGVELSKKLGWLHSKGCTANRTAPPKCIECGHDDVNLGWCGALPAPLDKLHCRKCCTIPACWKKA